jgi:serine/threonine protein phosphatase PrpC
MLRAVDVGEMSMTKRDKAKTRLGVELDPRVPSGQDAYVVDEQHGCFAVADGVGSSANSDVAAKAVCDTYHDLTVVRYSDTYIQDRMSRDCNFALLEKINNAAMGALATTTFTGATIHPDGVASYLHIGDSQLMLLRDETLTQCTSEHVDYHGLRNYLGTQPEWKALGLERHKLELTELPNTFSKQKVEAEWGEIHLRAGDRLALVTDGVLGSNDQDRMHPEFLRRILMRPLGALACARELLRESKKIDDTTAIVIDIDWIDD